jgi:hypothetical protein
VFFLTETLIATCRATKGIGQTQPTEWQDAGEALDHPELKGCSMPKGIPQNISSDGAYLQYNEVRDHVLYKHL